MLAGRKAPALYRNTRLLLQHGQAVGASAADSCWQAVQDLSPAAGLHTSHQPSAVSPAAAGFKLESPTLPLPRFVERKEKHRPPTSAPPDALGFVKSTASAKFDETVELTLVLGTDPKRSDQTVRGAATLPHGTGRQVRVAVFAEGSDADAARSAGADMIGSDETVARIQEEGSSAIDFDKCIATPSMQSRLGKIARILGPRGLMPNPKLGTLTTDVAAAVRTMKQGRVEFRADRGSVLHAGIGKVSFDTAALEGNALALVRAVLAARPKGVKGSGASGYILRAYVSSTMGPGFGISTQALVMAAQAAKSK